MITDIIIEKESAGYYCVFADQKIKHLLNDIVQSVDKEPGVELNEDASRNQMVRSHRVAAGLEPATPKAPTDCMGRTFEPGMKVLGHGQNRAFVTPNELNAIAADRMQFAAEHPTQYAVACAAPVIAAMGGAAVVGGAVAAAPAVATAAPAVGTAMVTGAKAVGKGAVAVGKTTAKVAGNVAAGVAAGVAANPQAAATAVGIGAAALWIDKHPKAKATAEFLWRHKVATLAIAGASYILAKTRHTWVPFFKKLKYSLFKGDYLARCDFTADGVDYSFVYDLSYNKWILKYRSLFRSVVPKEDVLSFTNTHFASEFVDQCKSYCLEYFNNEKLKASMDLVSKLADRDVGKKLSNIFKNEDQIRQNMFNLKVKVLESVSSLQ